MRYQWFASSTRGVEGLLRTELEMLGAIDLRETVGGCHFTGDLALGYRSCLWSRIASRILLPIGRGRAADQATFYETLRTIEWQDWMSPDTRFAVDVIGTNAGLRNSQFAAQRCKDAIVDHWRERTGGRPEVDRDQPQLRINVHLTETHCSVALDFAGDSLHRRGYRDRGGAAPLKETLAAALLVRAGWPDIALRGGALIDPMCGSGTLLIEGAMMAADVAPGLLRHRWGFEHWPGHQAALWQEVLAHAQDRAGRGRSDCELEIRGYDADAGVLRAAAANVSAAGLDELVRLTHKPIGQLRCPTHRPVDAGLLICNPPYGERLGETESLRLLYGELGQVARREFPGWTLAVFTGDRELGFATGLRSHRQYRLFNGPLPALLLLFDLGAQPAPRPDSASAQQGTMDASQPSSAEQAALSDSMFGNRLRKNLKRLKPWLRTAVSDCYRLYDADMPEYALAVDRYGDWLHVAEYAPPKTVDAAAAQQRLDHALAVLPGVTGVPAERIVCKRRERQRGPRQYQRLDTQRSLLTVHEGKARLQVNLHDYLDTGLFLDHRPLRLHFAASSRGRRFLNLFCYTASASVQAALGGARSTTSVDLSATYLDWARRNFALNGLGESSNHLVRADCLEWLHDTQHRYDTIFLDPPSFSNSKRMDSEFDVQRDHAGLIEAAMAVLAPGGQMYVSTNRRGFRLDETLAQRWQVSDITRTTLDPDFTRQPPPHRCWLFETGN